MQKVLVLINNKSDFRYRQLTNLKDYQVEYLDITSGIDLNKIHADIVILNKECLLNSYNLLFQLVMKKERLIVYISKNLEYGTLYNILEEPNFILLADNNLEALGDILRYAVKTLNKINLLNKKITSLTEDLKAQGLVREAKLKLMKKKGLSEDEAYKYIINLAMQKRIKKGELAKLIIEGVIL